MSDKPATKVPPVSSVDDLTEAIKLRKRTLASLNKLPVDLRKWVVVCLGDDMEKANS
jgi:hypothetical protein